MPFIIVALLVSQKLDAAGGDIQDFVDWAMDAWNRPGGPGPEEWEVLRRKQRELG